MLHPQLPAVGTNPDSATQYGEHVKLAQLHSARLHDVSLWFVSRATTKNTLPWCIPRAAPQVVSWSSVLSRCPTFLLANYFHLDLPIPEV